MTTRSDRKESGAGRGPCYVKRVGMIRGTVWENENDGRTYFNVNVVRRYRDGDEWKDGAAINGLSDIVAAIEVLTCCKTYINAREEGTSHEVDE